MTLIEFRDILLTADPGITRYDGAGTENYSVWYETGTRALTADDHDAERVWLVQVDRFTKIEDDPVVAAIQAALQESDVSNAYSSDFEVDTRYIHHIWSCEVI